jgi:hypothetical protein
MAPELVLATAGAIHAWRAASPGLTIYGAHLGRLVVTTRRLLFFAGGSDGIDDGALDEGGLAAPGSLALPVEQITARLVRRWDGATFLSITSDDGERYAFMARLDLGRARLHAVHAAVAKAQAERRASPYRS